MFYEGEVEAAAKAMEEKRRELIAQPLSRIYYDLALEALTAAAVQRTAVLSRGLDEWARGDGQSTQGSKE